MESRQQQTGHVNRTELRRGRAGHVQSLIQVSASSALLSARRGQNHQASGN